MPAPFLAARVEKPSSFPCFRVDAAKIWTLVMIVGVASQGQIAWHCFSTMLFGDDVINFERDRCKLFGQLAVFAAAPCSLSHEFDRFCIHAFHAVRRCLSTRLDLE